MSFQCIMKIRGARLLDFGEVKLGNALNVFERVSGPQQE